jgi:enamine deaminase RidA (YjgF/YER057c/UK114 family)
MDMRHQAPEPVGLYEPFAVHGQLVALSAISSAEDGVMITGKVGRDLDLERAQLAARLAARNLLAVLLEAARGDISRVVRVLMVRGHVNAAENFLGVHKVIDAASELIVAELGDKGRHARTAIGCATLPNGNAVTLEALAVITAVPS